MYLFNSSNGPVKYACCYISMWGRLDHRSSMKTAQIPRAPIYLSWDLNLKSAFQVPSTSPTHTRTHTHTQKLPNLYRGLRYLWCWLHTIHIPPINLPDNHGDLYFLNVKIEHRKPSLIQSRPQIFGAKHRQVFISHFLLYLFRSFSFLFVPNRISF